MNAITSDIISWAQAGERVYQIPAALNIAAAIIESALGVHTPPGTNNWHGIKSASGNVASTREQNPDGSWYTIQAGFKVFPDPAASFMGYAKLLGLGSPYHDAVTAYLATPRAPADVEALTRAIAARYATALSYATALIAAEEKDKLFPYDQLPSAAVPAQPPVGATPVTTPAPTATPATAAAPSPTPAAVPAAAPPVTVDYGDLIEQFLKNEESLVATAVGAGVQTLSASAGPLGGLLAAVVGPSIVNQYVGSLFTAGESFFAGKTASVSSSNFLESMAANAINAELPFFSSIANTQLPALIKAAVAKVLPSVAAAA